MAQQMRLRRVQKKSDKKEKEIKTKKKSDCDVARAYHSAQEGTGSHGAILRVALRRESRGLNIRSPSLLLDVAVLGWTEGCNFGIFHGSIFIEIVIHSVIQSSSLPRCVVFLSISLAASVCVRVRVLLGHSRV